MAVEGQKRPIEPVDNFNPEPPYPIYVESTVITGFGRGSKQLGIPTANISPESVFGSQDSKLSENSKLGVYYGWAKVFSSDLTNNTDTQVLPMVMSVGLNPFYGNKNLSAEVHIIHKFPQNFYGARIKLIILGYLRPELNYTTVEALINDINIDIQIALKSLERKEYNTFKNDKFLTS